MRPMRSAVMVFAFVATASVVQAAGDVPRGVLRRAKDLGHRKHLVGAERLLRFPAVTSDKVRLTILDSRDCPTIREFGLFRASPREGGG